MFRNLVALALFLTSCVSTLADDGARIVRIPAPTAARCINAKTDEITITLRYIKTQKQNGFLTQDNKAGVTVIATLNSDGSPKAQNPSVNLVDIKNAAPGQIYLPLEYPIASLLTLSSTGGNFTKNMALEMYLDKVQGANTFGQILDTAGGLLSKLPIPANPYTNAVSAVVGFATTAIKNETTDSGGQLFASVVLQFNDQDQSNVAQCLSDGFQSTGVIGVVGSKGPADAAVIPLDKINTDFCLRYSSDNTYEIQYARKPAAGCSGVSAAIYKEVPNDYVMIVISASKAAPSVAGRAVPAAVRAAQTKDLQNSADLCAALRMSSNLCGVKMIDRGSK